MLLVLFVVKKMASEREAILRLLCHTFLYCDGTSNGQGEDHVACAIRRKKMAPKRKPFKNYFVIPSCTATAQATVIPTIGLLPAPIRPIISTCAGTEEEPANCASECIRPIVSVMP